MIVGASASTAIVSSAVVAAVVGGISSFLTQRYLLERKAQVDYDFMARKRLYEAVGPLRMQLLFAARDVVRRVKDHPASRWDLAPSKHFARSFIYRLLRPLAIAQLIERQMGVADFAVDPVGLDLLRFNTAAERMLSGDAVVLGHPDVDWSTQSQHLFRDNLRVAAARLICDDDDGPVVMDYLRFQREVPDPRADDTLCDLALIFDRCQLDGNLTHNPLFWLRLVGYGYACNRLIATQGVAVGFEDLTFPAAEAVAAAQDDSIRSRAPEYVRAFEGILAQGL